ncbi:hypothetical protein FHS67_002896 [Aminobacter aminovorans]|uniref:Excisionase n=1 Tax=Aminobacter aminovorans TaxID=83263 RepID=A0AAC8YLZ3_AMIAI|nr:Excisionase [Aminobacter aminovorans]MBB3706574.1 hypothetical protein [Aminobacter aminovorans]
MPNAYSPRTLALEWQCSERHIRNLIERGELKAFHLGGKLLRIEAAEAEAFKSRNATIQEPEPSETAPKMDDAPAQPQRSRAARLDYPLRQLKATKNQFGQERGAEEPAE